MTYLHNLRAWLTGFRRFGEIRGWKNGWSADSWQWRLLYLFDYGSHVLSGGAVVSWSRWFYDNRQYRIPRFFDRLLNHFEDGHGRSAGPPLWGTKDCDVKQRLLAIGALVAAWFLWA